MKHKPGTTTRFSIVDDDGKKLCSLSPAAGRSLIKASRRAGITPENFVNAALAAWSVDLKCETIAEAGRMLPNKRTRAAFRLMLG